MNSGSLPFCLRTPYTWRFYCYAHDVDWPPHPLDSPAQVLSRFVYFGLMLLLQPVEISTGRTGCEQTESGTEGRWESWSDLVQIGIFSSHLCFVTFQR